MVDELNQEIRNTFATAFEVCTLDWRLRHMVKEERIFGQLHSHEKLKYIAYDLDHLDPTVHKVEGPSI